MLKKRLCRLGAVVDATGLSRTVIARLTSTGVIPAFRPDSAGNWFFDLSEVLAVLGLVAPEHSMASRPDPVSTNKSVDVEPR